MRKACPWQRTGGVVDHQVVDIVMGDAGLGEGLGAGDAERARGGAFFVAPAKAGVQGDSRYLGALDSCFRRNDGRG
jgi:hypothetical protein